MMQNITRAAIFFVFVVFAETEAACLNNKVFRKEIGRGDGTVWSRSCSWIRFKEVRRQKHCSKDLEVAANCQQTCGLCCENDDSYVFINDAGKMVECEWITKNIGKAKKRKAKYCTRQKNFENDVNIRDACPLACDFCFNTVTRIPTVSPSPTISHIPSAVPEPTKSPSSSPSRIPSDIPTSSPTDSPTEFPTKYCSDASSYTFNIDFNEYPVGCQWLSYANPEKRQDRYCYRAEIKSACKETCGFCDCVDNPNYRFKLLTSNERKGCAWLSKHKRHIGLRRARYCYDGDVTKRQGSDIADECPLACGFCSPRP